MHLECIIVLPKEVILDSNAMFLPTFCIRLCRQCRQLIWFGNKVIKSVNFSRVKSSRLIATEKYKYKMTPVGSLEGVCLSLIAGFPVPLKALHLGCAASEETFGLMLSDIRVKPTASSSCRILIVLTQISKQDRFPPYWWWMDYSPLAAIYSMLPSIYSMVKVTLNFALESFHWNIMYRKNLMYRAVSSTCWQVVYWL